jgi:membrane-bound lytic murein transglycosylase A
MNCASLRFPALRCAAVLLATFLVGCQTPPIAPPRPTPIPPPAPHASFAPASYADLPGWDADRVQDAWPAFLVGCKALAANARLRATWHRVCEAGSTVDSRDSAAVRRFLETNLRPYRVSDGSGGDTGLVSGYYEPLLRGSRTQTAEFDVPLYATPDDLLVVDLAELYPELKGKRMRGRVEGRRVVPYWARAGIDAGKVVGHAQPLAFVSDPVEAFFLEIQGSGRIAMDDGAIVRLGYADQNGHPYRAIARVLIDRGELAPERASMQAIADWGRSHPAELPALLAENPSYVFFREMPAAPPGSLEALIDGPTGSLGVPLLARRAVAIDAREIPLGAPLFLATTRPLSDEPLQRLVMAQDTGGAIRGPIRVDYFWGFGPDAGREAGRMRQQGRVWVLWPVDAGVPAVSAAP